MQAAARSVKRAKMRCRRAASRLHRCAAMRVAALTLLLSATGCLSAFVPDHAAATAGDAGSPAVGGPTQSQDTPAPTPDDGGTAPLDDGGAPDDGGTAPDLAPRSSCINLTTPNGDGHHNPGTDCLACHNGNGAPLFTVAGTLYASINGGSPVAGATIRLTDGKGANVDLVTGSNGNFYSSGAVNFPVTARASGCPNDTLMAAQVQSSGASCNGCHGSANRIHLP